MDRALCKKIKDVKQAISKALNNAFVQYQNYICRTVLIEQEEPIAAEERMWDFLWILYQNGCHFTEAVESSGTGKRRNKRDLTPKERVLQVWEEYYGLDIDPQT